MEWGGGDGYAFVNVDYLYCFNRIYAETMYEVPDTITMHEPKLTGYMTRY